MLNNLIPMVMGSQNPIQALTQLANFNPKLQQALDIYNQKTPDEFREFVKNACNTQNMNINDIVRQYNLPIKF